MRETLFEIYTWILCLSYLHEKQTSRIQSLHLYFIKIVSVWRTKYPFFIRPSSDGTYYGMVMSVRPSVRHSFPHFSPTCFEILSWNFVYNFILMHVRSSLNVIYFRQFLLELCPIWTSNSYKYAVFRTFLLHALAYWAAILHMTLFYYTTDQVRSSSVINLRQFL